MVSELTNRLKSSIRTGAGHATSILSLFIIEKCSDNSGCFRCEFGKGYFLEDKKGIQYAFRAGNNWYNLYSPTNSLLDHLEELKKMGIDCFRISLMGVRSPLEELKRLENWKTLPHQSLNHYRYFEGIE